jgi:putative acyl-CoA dehydrogenase
MPPTHEVRNQPPPLIGHNVFTADAALTEAVTRYGGSASGLTELGKLAGTEVAQHWGAEANAHPPALRTHDRYGHRIDEVEFHPSWHELMRTAVIAGLGGFPWASDAPAPHLTRAAGLYVWSQVEVGHTCPVSMTYAVVPALRAEPALAGRWESGLTARTYEPGLGPAAAKTGLLAGMAMTEKQGGSDVRANTTRAVPDSGGPDGDGYRLTGHKWFCSAPMCDLFLVLAQAPGGLTCFAVPRVLPGGERNTFRLQRLKDKLGNRSNASSEVEFEDTFGWRVGPEGRGVPTIIEMVTMTRLDCVLGSAALMRAATTQAIHHASHRAAFGTTLREQPLMAAVLADLALETEAATAVGMRLASTVDSGETELGRLALAVAKFWVCKRASAVAGEALECLGGNGFVEESGLPRLYREAPLNSIWEGSGNVIALDVLRALRRPAPAEAFLSEVDAAAGADARLDAAVKRLRGELADTDGIEARARRVATLMALCLQGSLLVRHAPAAVADAFCASRLDGDWAPVLGTLPATVDTAAIVDRAAVSA